MVQIVSKVRRLTSTEARVETKRRVSERLSERLGTARHHEVPRDTTSRREAYGHPIDLAQFHS